MPIRDRDSQVSALDLVIIAVIVLFPRVLIEKVMPLFYESFGLYFGDFLFQTLSNFTLTFGAVLADFLVVRILVRCFPYGGRFIIRSLVEVAAICLVAFLVSLLIRLEQRSVAGGDFRIFDHLFLFTYVSNLVFNAVVMLVIDLIFYYRWSNRRAVAVEAEKRARANYQYQLLKSETNPHFLFNCLNVLQYLIHEDADRASDYAGKLAGVYRYFLKLEKNTVVMLEEELEFVGKYNDLVRERFGSSFVTDIDIPREYNEARIIPCALQMMIENAVKHNIINSENRLRIKVRTDGRFITVSNNLNPKKHAVESSGMGLRNISRQYEILFSRSVEAGKAGDEFVVRIPLIL